MENSNANKQADADMTLLEMEDMVEKAQAMVSFISGTLLMASSSPSEVDENWFGELSLYASNAADALESVVNWLSAKGAPEYLEVVVDAFPADRVADGLESLVHSLPAKKASEIFGFMYCN